MCSERLVVRFLHGVHVLDRTQVESRQPVGARSESLKDDRYADLLVDGNVVDNVVGVLVTNKDNLFLQMNQTGRMFEGRPRGNG